MANEYDADLETAEDAISRIKERLFSKRNPKELEDAISKYFLKRARWPSFKDYWEILIAGVKRSVQKQGK